MAITKEKREKITALVMGVVTRLDTGKSLNTKRFETLLKNMSDEEFDTWASQMGHDLDDTIQLFFLPFEEPSMEQIKDAADFLKIPLEEYVWYWHNDPNGTRTRMKVPVGYCTIKRLQQTLSKKNRYAFDADEVSFKTGDVKGDSKVAALSDAEALALSVINADYTLKELLGPRANAQDAKREMLRQIVSNGYTTLESLPNDPSEKTTLMTLNTYLLASGIRSDLVTSSLETPYTLKKRRES